MPYINYLNKNCFKKLEQSKKKQQKIIEKLLKLQHRLPN